MPRPAVLATLAALLAAAASAPAAAAAAPPAEVRIAGGKTQSAEVCGAVQALRALAPGERVEAVVRAPSSTRARTGRRGSRLVVERCAAGRWERVTAAAVGATARTKRLRLDSSQDATGDYRVHLVRRGGKAGKPAFVRVGVGEIVDVPVEFQVKNQNRTALPCFPTSPDGSTVTVRGSLVAPRSALEADAPAATLYLHGLSYSQRFFRLQSLPGYDYGLEQARSGHTSIVVDRLGYPQSRGPEGSAICYSSQADAADQVIKALRSGSYTAGGSPGTAFGKVALAGHSAGGFIAEMTQYFFGSADALAVLSYSDTGALPPVLVALGTSNLKCLSAPERADGDAGPPGYAYFGETQADFKAGHVFAAEPEVVAEALTHRTRDPCGDLLSIGPSFLANQLGVRAIDVPVLLLIGDNDAFFGPPAGYLQHLLAYVSSPDEQFIGLASTGHGLTLGRSHRAFRTAMHRWLGDRGF